MVEKLGGSEVASKRENEVVLLVITDGQKWRYFAVVKLSALLRELTLNNNDFFVFNCFRCENKRYSVSKM